MPPLALQLRNLQSLAEIGVDKNTTVVFPAPLMTTIAELGTFLAREKAAATKPVTVVAANGGITTGTAVTRTAELAKRRPHLPRLNLVS